MRQPDMHTPRIVLSTAAVGLVAALGVGVAVADRPGDRPKPLPPGAKADKPKPKPKPGQPKSKPHHRTSAEFTETLTGARTRDGRTVTTGGDTPRFVHTKKARYEGAATGTLLGRDLAPAGPATFVLRYSSKVLQSTGTGTTKGKAVISVPATGTGATARPAGTLRLKLRGTVDGAGALAGTFKILNGKGLFKGVKGRGTYRGTLSDSAKAITLELTGVHSYPKAKPAKADHTP